MALKEALIRRHLGERVALKEVLMAVRGHERVVHEGVQIHSIHLLLVPMDLHLVALIHDTR